MVSYCCYARAVSGVIRAVFTRNRVWKQKNTAIIYSLARLNRVHGVICCRGNFFSIRIIIIVCVDENVLYDFSRDECRDLIIFFPRDGTIGGVEVRAGEAAGHLTALNGKRVHFKREPILDYGQ